MDYSRKGSYLTQVHVHHRHMESNAVIPYADYYAMAVEANAMETEGREC